MPVDTKNPQYDKFAEQWKICQDTFDGSHAVKKAGEEYLPKLTKQTVDEYRAYCGRAMFAPLMTRTVQGLTGAAVYKDFKIKLPASIAHLEEDATSGEMSLQALIKVLVTSLLVLGRVGILTDRPRAVAGQEEQNLPYLVSYTAQQVINWRETNGKLSLVVLEESDEVAKDADRYDTTMRTVWRVLLLVGGVYKQELYTKNEQDKTFTLIDSLTPTHRGKTLDYIPFTIVNVYGLGASVDKPPLYDFATVNLSHYRNSADLEHGRHFTGLPMLFLSGISSKDEILLGSSSAVVASDPSADGKYIEFTGTGLGALEKALESKEKLMAILGARLLESQRSGVEAEGTVRLRQMGDVFTLAGLNMALADGLSKALGFADQWQAGDGEVAVEPNTDFSDFLLDPQDITSLLEVWQAGGISLETFLYNLQRGERLPPGVSVEDEIGRIDLQLSRLGGLPALTADEKLKLKSV